MLARCNAPNGALWICAICQESAEREVKKCNVSVSVAVGLSNRVMKSMIRPGSYLEEHPRQR